MTSRSLQGRAVLAAGIGILVALVAVGFGVDLLASRHLHRSLDNALRQRAVEVAQLSASAPALLTTPGALDSPLGGTQLTVEVFDRRGRLVARSLALGARRLPAEALIRSAIAHTRTSSADRTIGGDRVRLYVAPLADFGGSGSGAGGAVAVAASERELHATLGSLRLFTLLAGLGAAILASAAVALLLRRALRPLGELADAAAEIERTGDPRRRLPATVAEDEVGRLASTLNAMLASLERARDSERRFLADASHELRTPLTALRGNVAYLRRHGPTPELLADLDHDAQRLADLADDLLALSREEAAGAPADEVRVDELASAAISDGDVDIVASEPLSVRGEKAALERALANLLANAHKHGPPGGRITVEVDGTDAVVRLSVSDEGSGVRAEEAELAFQRFWRARSDGRGSGLGLAIVRATAERHGGRAYAVGSRFTVELPRLRKFSESVGTTGTEEPQKGLP